MIPEKVSVVPSTLPGPSYLVVTETRGLNISGIALKPPCLFLARWAPSTLLPLLRVIDDRLLCREREFKELLDLLHVSITASEGFRNMDLTWLNVSSTTGRGTL
jgi:hypothetical protein